MGIYDTYIPKPPVKCPLCGEEVKDFQGKDGPCAMLEFTQGQEIPLDEFYFEYSGCEEGIVPDKFELHTFDSQRHWIDAQGVIRDGKWAEVTEVTAKEMDPK